MCTANIFLVAVILVCVMKEISFENYYTFFTGILLHVDLMVLLPLTCKLIIRQSYLYWWLKK